MKIIAFAVVGALALFGIKVSFSGNDADNVNTPHAASTTNDNGLASNEQMAVLLERAKTSDGLVLVESNRDDGFDILSNLPNVLAGSTGLGDNILVQVVRNQYFDDAKHKQPKGGWIQVDGTRYALNAVTSNSMWLFGYAKAPSREKIDALDFTIAICVDTEAEDTDGKALSFIEIAYKPKSTGK